ncbi:MAG: radical SAM protein, partial [Candidatus Hadarchaeales archaeon]
MGISNLSTVDWPGNLSAVVFLQGCDLRCPWCQNVEGINPRKGKLAETGRVLRQIKELKPMITAVVLSGGEPLLQPGAAAELLKGAKRLGLKTAIETNATHPEALGTIISHLDFVAIDVKAPLSNPRLYEKVTGSKEVEIVEKVRKS